MFGTYIGMKQKGRAHGYGVLCYKTGLKYSGEWRGGRWNGFGTLENPNGAVTEGIFEDGAPTDLVVVI